jgi:DNA-binding transcriptional ArsR family regulator
VIELPVLRRRGTCCELPEVDADWAESTAALLKAIADPTRLTMLAALWKARAPVCICDFVGSLELTQPTISHHVARLKEAGLVDSEKRGIWIYYRLNDTMPAQVRTLLTQLLG